MMATTRFLARLQLRQRWLSLVVVAIVIGLVGGVSIALVAGARRSATVVDRFFSQGHPYTTRVYTPALTEEQVRALPGVVRADPNTYLAMGIPEESRSLAEGINGQAVSFDAWDPTHVVESGRLPRPEELNAIAVNPAFVKEFGKTVGDRITVKAFLDSDAEDAATGNYHPNGPSYPFDIVGVIRGPEDIRLGKIASVDQSAYASANTMYANIRFYDAHNSEFWHFGKEYSIQLEPGREKEFEAALAAAYPKGKDVEPYAFDAFTNASDSLRSPVSLETGGLLALGIALGIVGILVVAVMLRADQRIHGRDAATLRALGTTRSQLGTVTLLRTLPCGIAGAVLASIVAVVLSARFPIGIGRLLELDKGVQLNLAVVAIGVLTIVAFVAVWSYSLGHRSLDARPRPPARGVVAPWLARSGAPNEVVVGSHLAFGRGGGSANAPTRPAVVGGAIAIAVIVAAGVVVNSIDKLYSQPAEHGWPWDVAIGNVNFPMTNIDDVLKDPRLERTTIATYGELRLNGTDQEGLAFDPEGTAPPAVLSGRLPRIDSEIALGPKLLAELNVDVGSTVRMAMPTEDGPGPEREVTVVGTALTPTFGEQEIGHSALVTLGAVEAGKGDATPRYVLADVKGEDPTRTVHELKRAFTNEMQTDIVTPRIVNLHRVRGLPLIGLVLAALLGIVLLAYTLALSARARTRELGVLRALGLTSGHVGRVLSWEGIAVAAAIAIIGLPIGFVGGTYAWRRISTDLGVADHPVYAWWIVAAIAATAVLGVACAYLPARRARRTNVGTLLRVE